MEIPPKVGIEHSAADRSFGLSRNLSECATRTTMGTEYSEMPSARIKLDIKYIKVCILNCLSINPLYRMMSLYKFNQIYSQT